MRVLRAVVLIEGTIEGQACTSGARGRQIHRGANARHYRPMRIQRAVEVGLLSAIARRRVLVVAEKWRSDSWQILKLQFR